METNTSLCAYLDYMSNLLFQLLSNTLKKSAMAGNRTRINCLEGNYAHHYTTIAR